MSAEQLFEDRIQSIREATEEDAFRLADRIKEISEPGAYSSHDADFILSTLGISIRTVPALIKKYKRVIEARANIENLHYTKGEYRSSGAGAFGRSSNKRGRRTKPSIWWDDI
jgi:hypothetical protein